MLVCVSRFEATWQAFARSLGIPKIRLFFQVQKMAPQKCGTYSLVFRDASRFIFVRDLAAQTNFSSSPKNAD